MAGDPRVLGLLEEMLDAGKTPEEVCRGCPELLAEVRERWREFRLIDAAVVELLPGLRTTPGVGAVTPVPPAADLPQVPGYELFGEVGRGGMGVVYRARDLALDRDVAVKLLQDGYPADSPIARRFVDEARITGQLQHPGIPAVYQVGTLPDGRPFLAMKLIKGRTLADLLGERAGPGRRPGAVRGRSSSRSARRSPTPTARGHPPGPEAGERHGRGVRRGPGHGLGPGQGPAERGPAASGRPLGGRRDGDPHPTDRAIRHRRGCRSPAPTQAGSVLGTPAYMPPEQAGGEVDQIDARSDVFGLGAILCEVLTGKPPYTGRDADQSRSARRWPPDQADAFARLDACGADPELVALCKRCLAPEPDDRPRDAGEVAAAVAALRAAAEERARRAELDRVRAAEQGKRRRVLLAASGAVAVGAVRGECQGQQAGRWSPSW